MTINFTNITDTNSTLGMIQAINIDLTGGWFFLLVIIAFFIILMISFDKGDMGSTLTISLFMVSIISGIFWLAGLVPMYIWILTTIFTFVSVIVFFMTR